jgi:hypothetical protein
MYCMIQYIKFPLVSILRNAKAHKPYDSIQCILNFTCAWKKQMKIQKRVTRAYLMKIIPETRSVHYIRYLRFYYHHWVDTTAGELLVLKGIIPIMFGTDMVY